jgi:hypothetical protein
MSPSEGEHVAAKHSETLRAETKKVPPAKTPATLLARVLAIVAGRAKEQARLAGRELADDELDGVVGGTDIVGR